MYNPKKARCYLDKPLGITMRISPDHLLDKSRVINCPYFLKKPFSQNLLICGWGDVDNVKKKSRIDFLLKNIDHLDQIRILIRH